jgi:hypothetical protein
MRAILIAGFFFAVVTAPGQNAPRAVLNVGYVKDHTGYSEPGCELLLPADTYKSERYIFLSVFDGDAVMNINGRDSDLKLLRSQPRLDPEPVFLVRCGSDAGSARRVITARGLCGT